MYSLHAACVFGSGVAVLVDLQDPGYDAVQKGPVVGDHCDPARDRAEKALEAVEPGEIEVVGRFVEQKHVESSQQDRGQPGPPRLSTGQISEGDFLHVRREAQVGGHRPDPGVEVISAESQKAVQGIRI